jgi:hypothetical protein
LPVLQAEPEASPFFYVPGSLGSSFPWQLVSFRTSFLRQPPHEICDRRHGSM